MQTKECIETRRSIRKFLDKPVELELIQTIVKEASFAPSWKNSQTVRYTAVLTDEIRRQIADECMLSFEMNSQTVLNAAVLMVISTVDKRSGYERDGSFSTSKGTHWQSFDAGIATQTFCLSAHDKGLGTVILGIYDEEKVARVIGLPDGESVSALVAV